METSRYALTQAELDNYKANGLISQNIESLAWKIKANSRNSSGNMSDFYKYLKTIGIRESFVPLRFDSDLFFLTDLVLIHCEGYDFDTNWHYDKSDPKLSFIPLEYVEVCEVQFGSYSTFVDNKFEREKPSVAKGAVVGGLVAGTTGAVIGAAAASQSEGKLKLTPAHMESHDTVKLAVKIKDESLYKQSFSSRYDATGLRLKNDKAKALIYAAKSAADMESKKKLANEGAKANNKEAFIQNNLSLILWGSVIVLGFIVFLLSRL